MDSTVVKALRIIEALARAEAPCGVSTLSRELGLTKSNVHRLLGTLVHCGYVDRADGGLYRLSAKLWHLGSTVMARRDIREVALPYLRELKDETGETARLTIFLDDHGVCIAQVQSDHPVGVLTQVGGTLLAYCSATGKALLAHQPDHVISRVARSLKPHTPHTSPSESELRKELSKIRKVGYAVNRGEWRSTVTGVGAPVRDGSGEVLAAIGISGPMERLKHRQLRAYGPMVRDIADRLSADLGYYSSRTMQATDEDGN
jgi:IclR family KDG regulon transcriptional repressor